jgi:hypothetical protein
LEAEVDPEKFDRILLNLISNAFKFTPAGGQIECTLSVTERDQLLLTVRDSGPGVEPELRDVIFERFRQRQSGMTRSFGGTGLGLAITKEFLQLHGGNISVSDAPGGGALFRVELPRRAPQGGCERQPLPPENEPLPYSEVERVAARAAVDELHSLETVAGEESEAMKSSEKPSILLSEDNTEMRRFITEILSDEYRVVPAADERSLSKHVGSFRRRPLQAVAPRHYA